MFLDARDFTNYLAKPLCLGIAFEKQAPPSSKLMAELKEEYLFSLLGPSHLLAGLKPRSNSGNSEIESLFRCELVSLGKWGESARKKAADEGIEVVLVASNLKAKKTRSDRANYRKGKESISVKWLGAEATATMCIYDYTRAEEPIARWKADYSREESPPFIFAANGKVPKKTGITEEDALVALLAKNCAYVTRKIICRRLWDHQQFIRRLYSDSDCGDLTGLFCIISCCQQRFQSISLIPKDSLRLLLIKRWKKLAETGKRDTLQIKKEIQSMTGAARALLVNSVGDMRVIPLGMNDLHKVSSYEAMANEKRREQSDKFNVSIKGEKRAEGLQEYHVILVSDGKLNLPIEKNPDLLDFTERLLSTLHFKNPECIKYKIKGNGPFLLLTEEEIYKDRRKRTRKKDKTIKVLQKASGEEVNLSKLEEFLVKAMEMAGTKSMSY